MATRNTKTKGVKPSLGLKQIGIQKQLGIETRFRYQKMIAAMPLGIATYFALQFVTKIIFG